MTIRELTVLVRLFQACPDPALRRWAIQQVPELSEWDTPPVLQVVDDVRLTGSTGSTLTQEDVDRILPR